MTIHLTLTVFKRIGAKLIDLGLVFIFARFFPYPFGPLLGFIYSVFGDGIQFKGFRGQSLGKKLLGLQVIHVLGENSATWKDSMFRNAPVGVATFFGIIPVWGWLILILVGVPLMLMEIYLMVITEAGRRLGDVMADTEVIEL